jgi:hypothetical protein
MVIHLVEIFGDEVDTESFDLVPFSFYLNCSPGSPTPPCLAALLLLAFWPFLLALDLFLRLH